MPENDNPEVKTQKDNYSLFIEKVETLEKTLVDLEKKYDDVLAMNRELLNHTSEPAAVKKEVDKKALEDKLMKGLRR